MNCDKKELGFHICFVNVQCLRTKWDLLGQFDAELDFDFIGVSEHWLKLTESEYYSSLRDKVLANIYCRTIFKNGGVAIYVRRNINSMNLDLSMYCVEKTLEVNGVYLANKDLAVVGIYRSPDGDVEQFFSLFDQCLMYLCVRNRKLVLGGDFNLHLNEDTPVTRRFIDMLRSYGLYLTSLEPTRGAACLDSVATNFDQEDYNVRVLDPVVADHCAVTLKLRTTSVSPNVLPWHKDYVFSYRVIDDDSVKRFVHLLRCMQWTETEPIGLIDPHAIEYFDKFFNMFCAIFERCFPVKIRRTVNNSKYRLGSKNSPCSKEWYSPDLARLRNLVLFCNDRAKTAVAGYYKEFWNTKYLQLKRTYRVKVVTAKKEANTRFIQNANNPCKAAWNIVNSHRKTNVSMACTSSPDEINSYFINVVDKIADGFPNNHVRHGTVLGLPINNLIQMVSWKEITPGQLISIVKGFKSTTSPDYYGLTVQLLREIVEYIAHPLCILINTCLAEGVFPDKLKIARVVPVFKKGDRTQVSSYRPIAILPAISKIFEAVMYTQLVDHFESNNLFNEAQHGFRRGRSTTTALLSVAGRVLEAYEAGDTMTLTLCDLSKAFDVVPHDLLLGKLCEYGVDGVVGRTLSSYLKRRWQVVSANGAVSARQEVKLGVPQGSILGPLLFLIMVNDFADGRGALLFADDTTLLSRGPSVELSGEAADRDLAEARVWFEENKLLLNEEKTQRLVCSLSRTLAYTPARPTVKLLGFVVDGSLSWEEHINETCKKLSRVTFLFRKLKSYITDVHLITAYHGLFHSHLTYGLVLWGHATGCERVLRLQKKVVRIITSSDDREHCKPIFKRLGILTVTCQYILNSLLHVYDNIDTFSARNNIHSHNTRNKTKIDIPRCRLSKSADRFPILALKMFNILPGKTKMLNRRGFLRVVKSWLMEASYYSVREFFEDPLLGQGCGPGNQLPLA